MLKANSAGSIAGTRGRGRFCASYRTWLDHCGRKFPWPGWNEKRMRKATHRPPQTCRRLSGSCLRGCYEGGRLEREWRRASSPRLTPVRGCAPDPAGAAPLRPALKSKSFPKGENTLPKVLANLRLLRCDWPIENLKSERRPGGGASLLVQAHRSIIKCCID
jgi:hypothetical protein